MGGDRETFLDKKEEAGDVTGSVAGQGKQRVRLHASGGEVHFHDDKAHLKASVPAAEWWKAWEGLRGRPGRWEWFDAANDTRLVVETAPDGAPPVLEARLTLERAGFGANYKELAKFTKRGR